MIGRPLIESPAGWGLTRPQPVRSSLFGVLGGTERLAEIRGNLHGAAVHEPLCDDPGTSLELQGSIRDSRHARACAQVDHSDVRERADELATDRFRRGVEVGGNGQDVGDRVVSGEGNRRTAHGVEEAARSIRALDEPSSHVPVHVVGATRLLIERSADHDVERVLPLAAHRPGVIVQSDRAFARADRAVADRLASLERRWRWVQGLRDRLARTSRRRHRQSGQCDDKDHADSS
jgi:hypothetical protein